MDTISHLALEGTIGWVLLKKFGKDSIYLQNRKRKFLFLSILSFSILPDFDIFLGLHRAYTHSLVWPTIFLFVGIILWRWRRLGAVSNQYSIQIGWISLLFVAFLLYSHILLDITGPFAIGLFYPFSEEQFELVIAIVFNSFDGRIERFEMGWRKITLQQQIQESNGLWTATMPSYLFYLLFFFILLVFHDLINSKSSRA
ncbi:MAG: metal-dependent hydrolase [Candidatus Heimdallarchaeota archaeon]